MGWPPRVGELLPRADEAFGVREKLRDYSLNIDHEDGGPKARGFREILGITMDSASCLEDRIYTGIREVPISTVRENRPFGINCVVEIPLRGIGRYRAREVNLRTIWLVVNVDTGPRLVSALLKP
jgi:hypothetical protein